MTININNTLMYMFGMNKSQFRKQYNKLRFDVLEGNNVLVVADHERKTITEYIISRVIVDVVDTYDKVENAYLTNGWKHLRQIEDNVN